MEVTKLCRVLMRRGACIGAIRYFRQFSTPEEAWAKLNQPSWVLWAFGHWFPATYERLYSDPIIKGDIRAELKKFSDQLQMAGAKNPTRAKYLKGYLKLRYGFPNAKQLKKLR